MADHNGSARWERLRAAFDLAADAPAEKWTSIVTAACEGDEELIAQVMRMLAADDGEHTVALDVGDLRDGHERTGQMIASYRIGRLIGRGGMGAVYEAARSDGTYDQRVAVKFVRSIAAADGLGARFRRERQILASLEHANIARLIDGGVSAAGEPYFVMEFIEGSMITDFADAQRLSVNARLRLFLQACAAVEHAHGRFIVHRDIKPANILVAADGGVKLLDFGVAKLLGAQDGDDLATLAFSQPLTPEYASPEQLRSEPASAASDVYSLGVVLFELLAGVRPHTHVVRSPDAALRAIATGAPRPSSVVSLEAAARRGKSSAPQLRDELTGELDNIVHKALHADLANRYPSVERLSNDIVRYLAGLPVSAQPDTVGYRLAKFVRRNRTAVGAAAAITLSLAAAAAIAVVQLRRESREVVWEMAVNAAANLDELGVEHLERGDVHGSDSLLRAAIHLCDTPHAGPPPLTCARSLYDDGLALLWKGDAAGAEQVLRRVLAMVNAATPLTGVQPPELQFAAAKVDAALGRARDGQGDLDSAVKLFLHSGQLFHTAGADGAPDRPETLGWFAITLERMGRFVEADSLVRLQLTLSHAADRPIIEMHLADIHRRAGNSDAARVEMARARGRRGVETDTTDLYFVLVTQIEAQEDLAEGRVDQAVDQLRHTVAIAARRYQPDDPRLAEAQGALGQALVAQHHSAEAVPLLSASAATFQARWGTSHPATIAAARDLQSAQRAGGPTVVEQ